MVEKFVTITERNGVYTSGRDIWTVEISHGKYHISCNGSPICYGQAKPGVTCEQIVHSCCGKHFKKVG